MKPKVSLREALADPALLGAAIPGDSWLPWRTLLIASVGEVLTEEERAIYASLTGRALEPQEPAEEVWAIVGRRAGKTRAAATLAAYVGALCDHDGVLAPGERGVIPILAASVSQASRAFLHVQGVLEGSSVLRQMISAQTADTIRTTAKVDIEVRPASFRTIRGVTAVAAIADEVAFWQIENSANADGEILNALRPALATTGGPLWVISSPYAKRGELYGAYRRDFGPKGDPRIMVAKAPSRALNPSLPQRVVDRALARDPAAARAEFLGEFRDDVEAFVALETVEACVARGVISRPFAPGLTYRAFVDPSGGSQDAMTLAIGHVQDGRVIVDAVAERAPPFSPEAVVVEFAGLLSAYGLSTVVGDRYGGEWPREAFRRHGIEYRLAEKPRSDLYRDALPLLNAGRIELLDSPKLVAQIASLERRVARGGRDSIDHPPGGHDDLANAVAGVASLLARPVRAPFKWHINGRVVDSEGVEHTPPTPEPALAKPQRADQAFRRLWGFGLGQTVRTPTAAPQGLADRLQGPAQTDLSRRLRR